MSDDLPFALDSAFVDEIYVSAELESEFAEDLAALDGSELVQARGLRRIHDSESYRLIDTTWTWEQFCLNRAGMSRVHADRKIAWINFVDKIEPIGSELSTIRLVATSEGRCRPLIGLSDGDLRAVERLLELFHDTDGIKPGDIAAAVVEVLRPTQDELFDHQLINQSTNNEWYTPEPFLKAARAVMGGIDLDPASNGFANQIVQAGTFYTEDQDGLDQPWFGRVWLNPPYGRDEESFESNQSRWSSRLIEDYGSGAVAEAILLVNCVPGNSWFVPLKQFPMCLPDSRIRFYNEETEAGAPTHSNALVYFGRHVDRFVAEFAQFGAVVATREVWDASNA